MSNEHPKQLKILSLDGGGVRGLSSLNLLKRIMGSLSATTGRSNLQPYEYFDLIGGTSTGGIIALMLGRMRMSIDSCIDEYERLGEIVFANPQYGEFMFDQKILVQETKKVIAKHLGDEDAPLLDPLRDDACKTVLYTIPSQHMGPETATALRTYINKGRDPTPEHWSIWEAVGATSAALTVFAPFAHGPPNRKIRYMDAGFGFNNPSRLICEEAMSLWRDDDFMSLKADLGVFLSLGTGMDTIARMHNNTIIATLSSIEILSSIIATFSPKFRARIRAIDAMKRIVTGTETTHRDVALQLGPNKYYRFNVDRGLQDVELFDFKRREDMIVDTRAYLDKVDVRRELRSCVETMEVLPLREPGLLENRHDEKNIYSLGQDGSLDDQRFRERLNALRINWEFESHRNEWENEVQKPEARYYKRLYDEIGAMEYIWNAVVLGDLLDERGRRLLSLCTPNPDRPRDESPERTAARIELANDDLSNAFHIYRQLLHTAVANLQDSFMHCWTVKRLGGILEVWGCRREARELYKMARDDITRKFGEDHWSSKGLQDKIDRITDEFKGVRE